jgi:hypothetical protein
VLNQFRLALRHSKGKTKSTFMLSAGAVRKITMPQGAVENRDPAFEQGSAAAYLLASRWQKKTPDTKEQLTALQSIEVASSTPPLKFLFVQNNSGQPIKVVVEKVKKEE